MKVCLDAGHGGYDPGAVAPTGLKEKDVALEIALQVGKLLQAAGIQVGYTRTNDTVPWPANVNQDLQVRSQIANGTGADLFVAIHLNSGSAAAHGIETYCLQTGGQGEKAASLVQSYLVKLLELTDRGIKTANYYVLRKTSMPAILTEVCFISNPNEEAAARTAAFIAKAAQAIADGVLEYFGVAVAQPQPQLVQAAASDVVTIAVGGKAMSGKIVDGHTWGPVAEICKAKGLPYTWDETKRTMSF